MGYPLNNNYKAKQGLCHIRASDLNTIANMLNGLRVDVVQGLTHGEVRLDPDESLVLRVPAPGVIVPEPPETGDHVLMVQNGALTWVEMDEDFECPET